MSFSSIGSLCISALLASLIIGQVLRFPLPGQGGGILISDLAVVAVLFATVVWSLSHWDLIGHWTLVIGILLTPFILWSLFTLLIHTSELGPLNTFISLAYWFRLASHLLLLPALLILFQNEKIAATARRGLLLATAALVLLGFLQLWLIPDFSSSTGLALRSFSEEGWDPHQSRLTSTWLDPNFFGAFLAIMLPFVVINTKRQACPPKLQRRWDPSLLLALVALIIIALLLTQSRSALVALTLSALIFSPLITVRALRRATPDKLITVISTGLLLLIIVTISAIFLHDRLIGLATLDATAQLRLNSLKEAWQLAEQHAWLGVGYNAYQFTAAKAGLISNFTIHSRAGADNSLLTLWVTTGIIGVALFFLPWAVVATRLKHHPAALMSITTLFIHSQFVNSFLYSHLLITLIIIITLALPASRPMSDL